MVDILSAALRYRNKFGFSVIPVRKDKKPLIKWEKYQKEKASDKEIRDWFNKWPDANIGIVTGMISGVCVVDVDPGADPDELGKIIPDSLITPTSRTPRDGNHLFFSCPDDKIGNAAGIIPHVDFRGNGGYVVAAPSENGNGKEYSWNVSIEDQEISEMPKTLINILYNNIFNLNRSATNAKEDSAYNGLQGLQLLTEGRRDYDLFHIANCMVKGGLEQEYIKQVLEIIVEKVNEKSAVKFTNDEIDIKIKSAMDRGERRKITLSAEVREWVCLQDGFFLLTDCQRSLQLLTREEKKNLYVVINRLVKQNCIEKHGDKSGVYRIVQNNVKFVDISSVPDLEYLPIKWPMGIENYVKVSPKSISVIAGETEAGKSAFLSNFAHLNLEKHKILYFSSEMTASRFKNRVNNLKEERSISDWKKLLFTEDKTENFHDSIDPDAINIIDYLELDPEKVFNVATYLRKIFDKLNKGIVVVALQKKRGERLGYGQDWTAQKAEFYLTISRDDIGNIMQIEKAKGWVRDKANPVGLKRRFLLYQGIKFFPDKLRPEWFKGEGNKEEDYT